MLEKYWREVHIFKMYYPETTDLYYRIMYLTGFFLHHITDNNHQSIEDVIKEVTVLPHKSRIYYYFNKREQEQLERTIYSMSILLN